MVSLVEPDVTFESSYHDAFREFEAEGRDDALRATSSHTSFASFVQELHDHAQGRHLPEGWVAGSTLWLVDTGGTFIGQVEIRHRLTEALRLRGGHVGYAIRPSMQRRGYGTRALALALPECVKLGLDRVLVTCDKTNDASRRIIEANGGVLDDAVQLDDRPVPTMRFWIELNAYVQ
jgi:predicted acetyltransferase